ncbi:MAG: choice-of-anchor Q domain-containing protein [Polyangiales bacterium]
MRALYRPLSVFAILLLPFIACMDSGGGEEGCADLCFGNACPDPCEDVVCPEDGNRCTREYCSGGRCTSDPVTNGIACTYSGGDGVCVDGVCGENLCEGVTCDDGDECTDGRCDYVDGVCDFTPTTCDDGKACTENACDSSRGCVFSDLEDGTACDRLRVCESGRCVPACDPGSGEATQCPILGSEDLLCCPGSDRCTDQYNCAQPVCEPSSAEVYECPIGGLEDLVCCPLNSYCKRVCCQSANECDDGDPCTRDECTDTLCSHTPLMDGNDCADGAGMCLAGVCVGTFPCTEEGIRAAIEVGGGPHSFDCPAPTRVVTRRIFNFERNVILDGEGNLSVDTTDDMGVFSIPETVTVELRNLAITAGAVPIEGSVIWNSGNLAITNSSVSGGLAERRGGGGIHNQLGTLTLTDTVVSGNRAIGPFRGGGITNSAGTVTLVNSTVSGNSATSAGGIRNSGELTLMSSTVSGNTSETSGGGILGTGTGALTLVNSTVSGNAAEAGGGLSVESGAVSLIHCTFVANSADSGSAIAVWKDSFLGSEVIATASVVAGDCSTEPGAATSSNGYNIETPGDTCGFDHAADLVGVSEAELHLGPLQDNGGPTDTHDLLAGSVAIDRVPSTDCVDADGEPLTTDQRGEARPAGPACDVGAVEPQL